MKSSLLFYLALIISFCCLPGCEGNKKRSIRVEVVRIDSLEQVVMVSDSLVKPFVYINVSGLEKYDHKEAKMKFISLVLPSILVAKYHLETRRYRIDVLREKKSWDKSDSAFYYDLINRHKAEGLDDLISKLKTIPTSIVLAQAIVETGWGRSRFFIEGNNLFGVWSVKNNETRIAADKARKDKVVYLKTYPDMSRSALDYLEILSRSRAYRSLRNTLLQTNDPFVLLPHLKNYSEERTAYTRKLEEIILQNNLIRFDHFQIDPQYLVDDNAGIF